MQIAERNSVHATYHSDRATKVNDVSDLHSSSPLLSTSCTCTSCLLITPTRGHGQNIEPVPTRSIIDHGLPLQTKSFWTGQHTSSSDRQFGPTLLRPASFAPSSSRSQPSMQASLAHSSPSKDMGQTRAINPYPGFSKVSVDDVCSPLEGSEMFAQWQDPRNLYRESPYIPLNAYEKPAAQTPLNRWQQARDYRRKVYEPPYVDPRADYTIAYVEENAEFWVDRICIALSNTQDVKDTPNSHHRRLFTEGIDPLLIEACSREIFIALIDRCKYGFRGPPAFDKALKASHQLELDRTATCEQRIENVIRVLSWNKRACKDVLYEDWKIRLLVNHPLSYDKEKDSQKGSNDQRRKRQLAEREMMKRTAAELRAYRESHGEATMNEVGTGHHDDDNGCKGNTHPEGPSYIPRGSSYEHHEVRSPLEEEIAYGQAEGNVVKRRRI